LIVKNKTFILLVTNPNQSFVKIEIEMLAQQVEVLIVISHTHRQADFELPTNVAFHFFSTDNYYSEAVNASIVKVFLTDMLQHGFNVRYVLKARKYLSYLRQAQCLKKQLAQFIGSEKMEIGTPILSFWCDMWAVSLALLKKDNATVKTYSRLHGRDLYEERLPTTTFAIPFRPFVVKQLNGLFPISNHGTEYLKNKYPKWKDKITANYLGCPNFTVCHKAPIHLTILSIATIRHLKRIHRIAEVVRDYPDNIHWIHIGGEANRLNDETIAYTEKVIKEIGLQKNKQVTNIGAVAPNAIEKIVNEYNPHVLVNTSEYEGLPVSVMEALSMGVPCIATDVGGTGELVQSPFLLSANFSNDELKQRLQYVFENYASSWRTDAKNTWRELLQPAICRKELLKLMQA
jgi:glycosyltransferase involved in cell wall biosynthesis